jgi:hypothetical protein
MSEVKSVITSINGHTTEELYVDGRLVKFDEYLEMEEDADDRCYCDECVLIRDYAEILSEADDVEEIEDLLRELLIMYGILQDEELDELYEVAYKDGYIKALQTQRDIISDTIDRVCDGDIEMECSCDCYECSVND